MKQNWGNSQLLCFLLPLWYNPGKVVINMDTKEILLELRTKRGLSQEQLAEQVHVTRQAVSRWETRQLICQCCGMPMEDANISREPNGAFNEEYCKWCYADGKFVYTSLEELLNFLESHMSNEAWPPEQVRAYFEAQLPKLNHWKQPEA